MNKTTATTRLLVLTLLGGAVLTGMILTPVTETAFAGYGTGGGGGEPSPPPPPPSPSGHLIASGTFNTPNCVPALSVSCTFSPTSVTTGQTVTWSATASGGSGSYRYSWSGTDGLSCSGQPSSACQSVQKSYSVSGTKTGSVTVEAGSQSTSASCTNGSLTGVTITAAITSFTASPSSVASGGSSTLSWSSTAAGCTINQGIGSVPASGSRTVSPSSTTTYTLNCDGATDSKTVTVLPQCNDAVDNDSDGKIDYPADLGCENASDGDETGEPVLGPPAWKEVAPE